MTTESDESQIALLVSELVTRELRVKQLEQFLKGHDVPIPPNEEAGLEERSEAHWAVREMVKREMAERKERRDALEMEFLMRDPSETPEEFCARKGISRSSMYRMGFGTPES